MDYKKTMLIGLAFWLPASPGRYITRTPFASKRLSAGKNCVIPICLLGKRPHRRLIDHRQYFRRQFSEFGSVSDRRSPASDAGCLYHGRHPHARSPSFYSVYHVQWAIIRWVILFNLSCHLARPLVAQDARPHPSRYRSQANASSTSWSAWER
jgi:hypothetical protein